MQALVVFESMYGNTHKIADRIAEGLRAGLEVTVVPVDDASVDLVARADLLVVGGPTHGHGLTSSWSRRMALEGAAKPDSGLTVDPVAPGTGLRGWLDGVAPGHAARAAAFDTRIDAAPLLTGRASSGIARRLRRRGYQLVTPPESFLVDKAGALLDGELARARAWGAELSGALLLGSLSFGA